jgi:hypothetical protein
VPVINKAFSGGAHGLDQTQNDSPQAPAAAGRRTIAPDSTIDGPRDGEGKQTVWILDEKGEPLPVKVHITRGMKQLEIGRSCTTLDAH